MSIERRIVPRNGIAGYAEFSHVRSRAIDFQLTGASVI
jgi:hypothetical protein